MSDSTTDTGNGGAADGQGQQQTAPATPTDGTQAAQQAEADVASQQAAESNTTAQQADDKGGKGDDAGKTFTQADLDKYVNDRLEKQQVSFRKQLAQAFGIEDPNAETDPTKLLEQQQATTKAEQTRADTAEAKALALAAGIKPERVDRFVKLVDVGGALKDADRSDAGAVSEKLTAAVNATLEDVPEFKGAAVPASSGGDRSSGDSGKPVYTRDQIKKMSREELAEKSDELTQAMAEGRIK